MERGESTRQSILDHAVALASQVGIEGLTIGRLATDLDLSKSGLFGHFRSKEALQLKVLEHAAERFVEQVVRPALRAARGEPRLRTLFGSWLGWAERQAGGCVFLAASVEFDDRPGPVREALVRLQRDWLDTLAGAFRIAQAEGHLRPELQPEQAAFELQGILFAYHHAARLLSDGAATERARAAFERLLEQARLPLA